MRLQEIFDTVVTHLRQQGCKAESGGACYYRSPTGLKCAAGCLIPDNEYSPEMEGKSSCQLAYFVENYEREEQCLISSLQSVHDSSEPYDWETGFESVALNYQLKYTERT